jgi:uncharacterized membrane protein
METFLLIIILVIVLALLIGVKNTLSTQVGLLQKKLDLVTEELKLLHRDIQQAPAPAEKKLDTITGELRLLRQDIQQKPPSAEKKTVIEDIAAAHKAPAVTPLPPVQEKPIEKPAATPEIPVEKIAAIRQTPEPIHLPAKPEPALPKVEHPVVPPKPPKPGFFERNPDLEKFIGENLANKIGIAILVLGVGFFVKYAIDQEWIGEIGRVFIGILCGGILLGIAHYMRKTFTAFSSVLVGGGVAVLYLTIAIAFHEYHIFSQAAAFVIMVIITGFAVALSVAYDRIELAVLAILGGFGSPFMVSTGEGNYIVLFTYVLILDGGMLVLAYFKKWNLVNIIAYVFTLLLFGSWLGGRFDGNDVSMIVGALIFATLFYLVFFAMNLVNNLKERTPFKSLEIGMLLSNTFYYYGVGMTILDNAHGEMFKGLFTAALGIFNFLFAFTLYKNSRVDKNLVFLLIGLVLTFISLAAPVQLEGNFITLFWSAETVLLLWLSQKSGIRLMKLSSAVIMGLMIISLIMDWTQIYMDGDQQLTIMLNKGYITSLCSLVAIAACIYLLRFERTEKAENVQLYKHLLVIGGVVLLYVSQLLELRHQLAAHEFDYTAQNIIIGVYNMVFILGLVLAGGKLVNNQQVRQAFAFWGVFALFLFIAFYHNESVSARNSFLLDGGSVTGFAFHYILVTLVVAIAFITLPRIQAMTGFNEDTYNAYSWFYVFALLFVASAELDHAVVWIAGVDRDNIGHILDQNHKIGYPILWGLASFLLIYIGFKIKKKHLRIISLTLFLVTLIKLFAVDIRGISEGGKIAAFIFLGVLLLIVSFMYQRLKKLLLTDESGQPTTPTDQP